MNEQIASGFSDYKVISQEVHYSEIQSCLKVFGEKIDHFLKDKYQLFGTPKIISYGIHGSFTIIQAVVK